uniref:Reverse transcriptase/retrotransposon-derived protein RNase H-like domain-containing protein n=1 Tax=Fagus sylvatica TaxID=28930 RepID=A0A2N9HV67_FAGSY
MVALERKFDELLSFVQLIAKRNTEDENQRKEDDKDTGEAEPEGHSNTNATPPRPPTPPKPEGKDSQFKAPEFEKYNGRGDPMIHLQMYCRKMAPYADNEPLLIQTFQDTLTGNAAEWYSQLKKISHWKELADTFLAQYGFNSQIAPDRFDLQRMEKKSNETFREYAQEFFVDLIPVGDRIEDALKTKKIVDMTALMALAEQAAKKAPTKRKEGDVQMIGRNNGRPRQVLPTFTMQPIQPRPIQAPAPTQAPAPAPAPQMPARPEGNQPNDNRWPRKEPRQFTPLPMPMTELYPILIEKSLISPIVPKPYNGPQRRDFNPNSACDFHFGEVGHTVENCGQLRHRVQDLIDHGVLKFEGLPNITTNPLPKHPEGGVNMVEVEEGERGEYRVEASLLYLGEAETHHPWGEKKYHQKGSRQPDDPSEFDWYAEINLDDIVEDEMDLDNLQDEEADWGYFMEDDTDEWRDVDLTEFFQFPYLIVPPGFVTPEFEIFLRGWGSGGPFAKLRNLTGWDDLVRVFLERYRFNPHSILEYLGLKKDEEPYIIPDPGVGEVIVEIKEEPSVLSLPTLTEEEEEEIIPTKKSNYQSDILEALERQDEGSKPNIEELEIVNLANEGEEPREVKIGTRCAAEQKEALIALLREFHEIFAWSYQDMPGLDTDIVVHKIPLKPECKPVKQALRRMKPEVILKIKEGSGKAVEGRIPKHSNLFGLGSQYSPGAEEGRKTTNVVFSFMDGFSGYNQIKMAEEDKSKTAFVTHWGTFVYDVMPFGLKNAGATYQRAMCAFGVTSGKLLGFIVSGRGIEIDPAKVQAIRSMPAPRTEKEIRSFLGRINYIARFIAQLTATCEPLFKLLRKDVKIKWTEDCQKAFDKIKEYLLNPPILVPPTPGRPLILYLTVQEASMGCMLGQQDETGKKEQAIYYLSKKFTEPETRYLLVEKTCCALAWASKKLRQYMLYYTTWLVSRMDPIKYIFEKPALTGKIARWQVLLSEFDILFVASKGDQGTSHSRLLGRLPI